MNEKSKQLIEQWLESLLHGLTLNCTKIIKMMIDLQTLNCAIPKHRNKNSNHMFLPTENNFHVWLAVLKIKSGILLIFADHRQFRAINLMKNKQTSKKRGITRPLKVRWNCILDN